ncbi:ImmA/IrrE family metallo-endopeptidase [Glutamicibacter sp.]|uniref:ImmA/IrrE family metallo-endopeptidase n=1 Tax=Glutamicibacter sp. TaxID=1931995 RepID=UPI0028BDD14D|nr:ImmA/IrrE family metallo-endopeptidase [Glutamicibacter sp.]
MQNVWGMLRTLAQVVIVWTRPHPELVAATDGRHIWIDPKLTKAERHCFLAHEAIHIKQGHEGCQTGAIERQVCLETAQFLVSFEDLQSVAGWSRSPWDMAEELGVTEQVVIDRLQTLSGPEIQTLWPPSDHHP